MVCEGSGTVGAAPAAALDLHEGISDPAAAGCQRWPEGLRLVSSHGELVRGRCRATNQCAYCARLAAVENAELLALDALDGEAPEVWAVLTTSRPLRDPAPFYRAREAVLKALKRKWPRCEYAALVEFTTGYGPLAAGARRPHWNLLLKGIPAADVEQAGDVVRRVWCARPEVAAVPQAQYVGAVADFGGLMRYVALHFQKESQRPPEGWRGHRFLKSRGYLSVATPEARERARRSLRHKRELWRAIEIRGLAPLDAELAAAEAIALADATTWSLRSTPRADPPGRRELPQRPADELLHARELVRVRHVYPARAAVGRGPWVDSAVATWAVRARLQRGGPRQCQRPAARPAADAIGARSAVLERGAAAQLTLIGRGRKPV